MKKVLHISKYYYPFTGGIEQVARDAVRALQGKFEQKILCFEHDNSENQNVVDEVEVIRCKCQCKIFSQSISLEMGRKFKDLLKTFKPDYIVFHYPNPFFASILLRNIPKETKLILYWHLDITRQKILGKIFHLQNLALLKRADKIIATSPNYIEGSKYLSQYRSKCQVIPNCIDENRLAKTPKAVELAEKIKQENKGKTICLSVGRLVPYKGYSYLIKSAKKLDENSYKIEPATGLQDGHFAFLFGPPNEPADFAAEVICWKELDSMLKLTATNAQTGKPTALGLSTIKHPETGKQPYVRVYVEITWPIGKPYKKGSGTSASFPRQSRIFVREYLDPTYYKPVK